MMLGVAVFAAVVLFDGLLIYTGDAEPTIEWLDRNGQPCIVYDGDVQCRPAP